MPIKNFYNIQPTLKSSHSGKGLLNGRIVFDKDQFSTSLKFIHYTEMPPDTSIGIHTHQNDEEVYVILEGSGLMLVDGQETLVIPGDIILNKPFGEHALYNTGSSDLKVLIFKIDN